jgi:hypothetical protein
MTEYTGVMIGVLGVAACLLYVTFKLSEKYDPLKIFFIGMFFVWGNVVLHLASEIVDAATSPVTLSNAVNIAQGVWITLTVLVLIYITIYIIPDAWAQIKGSRKRGLYDDS